jgi:hypothetical protein
MNASCLCGGVMFRFPQPSGVVTACHCTQCRKLSGHFAASLDVDEGTVEWLSRDTMAEFRTPRAATRGFCATCGSSLWFRDSDGAFSVEAGAVDGPTGLRLACHIHTADKGDYYRLADGLPQFEGSGDD